MASEPSQRIRPTLLLLSVALILTGVVLIVTGPRMLGVGIVSVGLIVNAVALFRMQIRAADQRTRPERPRQ